MDVRYINPFISAMEDFCEMMLECELTRGNLRVAKVGVGIENISPEKVNAHNDVTALVSLTGPVRGTVAISFPTKTAIQIARKMLGTDKVFKVDSTVSDAIGEMVNIVAGAAKSKLAGEGEPIGISIPTVVQGHDFHIKCPTGTAWLQIPFTTPLGFLSLHISFEKIAIGEKFPKNDTGGEVCT